MTETMLMAVVPTSDRTIASRVLLDSAYALTASAPPDDLSSIARNTPTN
jgi:hypothetical protein